MSNSQIMLIDLDCLIDTRVATVARISPKGAVDLINNNYQRRISDELSKFSKHINDEEFKVAYAARDVDTLMIAQPTKLAFELYDIVDGIYNARMSNPELLGEIKIYINTWPYVLEEWEREDIVAAIIARLPDVYPVKAVSIPYSKLTTDYIQTMDFAGLFIYNLEDWTSAVLKPMVLDVGISNITHIPRVGIFPCMLVPNFDEMVRIIQNNKNENGDEADPFEMVSFGLSGVIGVEFQNSELYSIARFN